MMQQLTDPPAEKERTDQPVQQCDHTGIGIGTLQLITEILQVVGRIALFTGTQRAAAEKTDVHHVNAKRTGRCQTGVRQLKIHKSSKSGLVAAFFVSSP